MTKLKRWLCERFLPGYCRDEMLTEGKRLQERIDKLVQANERLRAYIDGMHAVLRRQQRITIKAMEVSGHERVISHDEQREDI